MVRLLYLDCIIHVFYVFLHISFQEKNEKYLKILELPSVNYRIMLFVIAVCNWLLTEYVLLIGCALKTELWMHAIRFKQSRGVCVSDINTCNNNTHNYCVMSE